MKEKFTKFLVLFFSLLALNVSAQQKKITGTVTAKSDGMPIPGVSIQVKGTSLGTQTDVDGKFAISIDEGATISFSYLGFRTKDVKVGTSTVLNVSLEADDRQLNEVVVTALGIKREQKSLGYAVQQVSGENLTVSKATDVSSSLAGKVAGVQLVGSPSSSFDNAKIIIRGINGLDPDKSNPLYVVDGTPTDQANVNMDNVESVSVLKGPSASALYGNRAANGVIVITSKKGKRNSTPSVELNLGATFENMYVMPKYQNEYAGGYSSNSRSPGSTYDAQGNYIFRYDPVGAGHPASWAAFDGQTIIDYGADESWGPKMTGQPYRPYYSWYPGADFGKLSPLVGQPNNVKDFFQTGQNYNNSVAVSGGGENFNYRVSYANQNRSLTLPGAKRNQHQVGISGNYDITKKLNVTTDIGYTLNNTVGQPTEGYNLEGLNVAQNFNQWFQRQLDMNLLKDYKNPDGSLRSWNIGDPNATGDPSLYLQPQYWDSPYFIVNENYGTEKRNRLVGNLGLNYQINNVFSLSTHARMSRNNGTGDFKVATGGLQQDQYMTRQLYDNEMNYDASLNFKKGFGNFSIDGLVGGNIRHNTSDSLKNTTQGGLTFPNYFSIAGSVAKPLTEPGHAAKTVRSVYGKASFGYKTYLYLDATLRNDWSSALPADNNSYLYPSIGTSFVFSELFGDSKLANVLSFGKIRGSYAQVGSDLDFNQVNIAILNGSIYDGNPSAEIGDQYRSGAIKPALTTSWEVGAELRFFNRIGLDVAYFQDDNTDQILALDVASAAGFSRSQINAGKIQRTGVEVSLSGSPIKTENFNWNTTLNWSKSQSIVKELAPGINNYVYNTQRNDFRIENRVGQKWGTVIGRKWKTDANGNKVFSNSTTGILDYTTNNELGSIMPNFTGGLQNNLSFKNFDLSFSLDFQEGGQFFSMTKMYNEGTGLSEATTGVNDLGNDIRQFPSLGGGVRTDGVTAAGVPTTVYVAARAHFYTNAQRDSRNLLVDASYLKLREVSFGYSVPKKWLGSSMVKNAKLSFIVNNAWLIAAPAKEFGIDPSELENFGREGGQLSSTRQFGFNLKAGF